MIWIKKIYYLETKLIILLQKIVKYFLKFFIYNYKKCFFLLILKFSNQLISKNFFSGLG